MAAGDRYKNGKPKDIVRHKLGDCLNDIGQNMKEWDMKTVCGRVSVGYTTNDWDDVTCLNCLKKHL